MQKLLFSVCRWFGRVLAFAITCVFVVFFVAEGGVNPATLNRVEQQMMIALAVCLLGFVVQMAPPYSRGNHAVGGAVLSLIGIFAFNFISYLQVGKIPGGPVFPFMFVPGVLEIIARLWEGPSKPSV